MSRYFFDTADNWNSNALETARHQAVQVQRVDLAYLDEARVDWSQFSWTTPEVLVPTGPKQLRADQQLAVKEVIAGLTVHDRGKMIRACGTGKTLTSLKIAEEMVGAGGSALFLVPSIQLLSQSLREWMQEAQVDIRPFAVCSDVRVGRKTTDEGEISTIDLTEPATTDAETLLARMSVGRRATPRMTVVFSTYQSIDVIAEAQQQGLGDFDLVICDEAHRTTGVTLAEGDESHFVKVHDSNFLKATKRLYMTATPRVFGEEVRRKASEAEAVLADMNDEAVYGPELHRLGFGDAVDADLLTDYKVVVLASTSSTSRRTSSRRWPRPGRSRWGTRRSFWAAGTASRSTSSTPPNVRSTRRRCAARCVRQGHQGLQAGIHVVSRAYRPRRGRRPTPWLRRSAGSAG